MITACGTVKKQKSQGDSKYESILSSDLFKKAIKLPEENSATMTDPATPAPAPASQPEPAGDELNNDRLQSTMNQSNSPSLNPSNGQSNPGDPLANSGVHADFALIANELSEFLSKSKRLNQSYRLVSQVMDQKSGKWKFEIEPAQQPQMSGPAVNKGGPPFVGGGGGQQGQIAKI